MANPEHLKILRQGVEVWNKWRGENPDIQPNLGTTDFSTSLSKNNIIELLRDFVPLDGKEEDFSKEDLFGLLYRNIITPDLSGMNLSGAKLSEAYFLEAKLKNVNLNKSHLSFANLSSVDLSYSTLTGAWLNNACLMDADLRHGDLKEAELGHANLSRANLSHANLIDAQLFGTYFYSSELENTDFTMAVVGRTAFCDLDLSMTKGLHTVKHEGPSTIGLDTIYRSNGSIPEVFLRGCGLKDWEIEEAKLYRPNLTQGQASEIIYKVHELRTNPAIQYHSCFISYSSKNQSFAEDLYSRLQNQGVRCWFAPEDIKIGDKFRQRIDEAIRIHDKLLVILSEDSISSAWVEEEVENAIEREHKEKRLVLFPVRIDDAVVNSDRAWAASLRRMRHIGDFSEWKDHGSYSKAFERLLRDLKAV